tara:strand:+ start:150 stop:449 length:300 start_codon:yes stop_codon:yes gene_type:complete
MKLAGKLGGLVLGGGITGLAIHDMTKPGRSVFTSLPQPKTEQEAIARQMFYDQRNYLNNNLGINPINPWNDQYGKWIFSNKPVMNHNTIYDTYLRNRGY